MEELKKENLTGTPIESRIVGFHMAFYAETMYVHAAAGI